MDNTHYKLPLDIARFFTDAGGHLEQYTELESVDQSLALLYSTHQGEHSFDRNYGTSSFINSVFNGSKLLETESFVKNENEAPMGNKLQF